jgi:hypothetical protein
VAPHPYALVDPALTLVSTEVSHGVLVLDYRTADLRDLQVTVAARPASADVTAPCSPSVSTGLGDRFRACQGADVPVPGGVAWSTPPGAGPVTAAVVVLAPDALLLVSADDPIVGSADLLPRVQQLRRTGAVTLLRSTEESVAVR